MDKKKAKLTKQLMEAEEMLEVLAIECDSNARLGFYDCLKSSQARSLRVANKIMKIKTQISQLTK